MKNRLNLILVILVGLFVLVGCQSQYMRTAKLAVRDEDDPEKAIKNLKLEIEQNPENAEAYLLMSKVYGQYKKDYATAFEYARKAVEVDPSVKPEAEAIYTTSWAQLHNQGLDEFEAEDYEASLKYFKKANNIFPDSLVTEKMLANTYIRLDSMDRAKDVYVNIIEDYPDDVKSRESLATIYYNNGKYEEAIKYYKDLVELEPNKINWPYNIAVCYSTMGEHNKALTYYKEALSYEPENKKLLHKIAATEFNNENYEYSANYYSKILEMDSEDGEALEFITRSYNFLKDWDNVLKYATKWKEVKPDSETARLFVNLAKQKLSSQ